MNDDDSWSRQLAGTSIAVHLHCKWIWGVVNTFGSPLQSSRDCKKFDLRSFRLGFSAREIRRIETIFS